MGTSPAILVVDDDDDFRETLRDALSFEGLTVEVAHNGQEALDWFRANQPGPRLVLLDLMMPVMDGRAFLRARAADAALARIPVVVMTAGGDCRDLEPSLNVSRCLAKTANLPELIAAILRDG